MAARDDDRELEKALLPGDEAAHDADDSYGRAQSTASASGDGGRPPVGVLYAASLIATWMAISTAVILWNAKLLLGGFPYPITLSAVHMLFQTCATRLLARFAPSMMTGGRSNAATEVATGSTSFGPTVGSTLWCRTILPIGILFAASLWLSNLAYTMLSVAFVQVRRAMPSSLTLQMVKSASPIATLLTLFAFGLKEPSVRLVGIILVICAGVLIASLGEADFHLPGFIIQCTAIAVEATRLALIQTLLQGSNFTPLTSLYSFAPVCFGTLALLIVPVEGLEALRALPQVGLQLIPNAALTFLLNVAAIYLVAISSLVLSLSKVAKDIALILGAMAFMGQSVSVQQWVGYSIALLGMFGYKAYS